VNWLHQQAGAFMIVEGSFHAQPAQASDDNSCNETIKNSHRLAFSLRGGLG